jgi:outer membrane protein assembly factor BamB
MKLFFSILLLTFHFSFAQQNDFAIITNPEIGSEENATNLIEAVNDINKRQNINYVVVLGNITENGKFDEFIWAQEILDGLSVPYSVVGGDKDNLLSEGNGSEISLLWGDDKSIHLEKNYSMITLNTILPNYPDKNYIDVETLSLLRNKLTAVSLNRVITFSYYPISLAENSYNFFELTLDKKIFSFVSKEDKREKNNFTYEGLYLNRKDVWGYLIVSSSKDSIYIKKILSDEIKKKVKPEIVRASFSKPLVLEADKTVNFTPKGNVDWSVRIDKTTSEKSIYDEDKIFTAFKDGSVICLNSNGKEKWRFETNKRLSGTPSVYKDLLVVASEDGDIFTLNANTGDPYQIIGIGEKITSGVSIIEIDEGGFKSQAIVVGTQYGNLYCYDLLTLDPVWTQQLPTMNQNLQITSTIASSKNKIFLQDNFGTLYCFSSVNGMLIWNIQSSTGGWKSASNLLARNNLLYLIDESGNLFCIDALLGKIEWDVKKIYVNGTITVNDKSEFVIPTKKNQILFVSMKSGKVFRQIDLPVSTKDESISGIVIINDNIFVGFSDGWLYKITTKKKVGKLFRDGTAPIVSLVNVNGNCLVTDYDGKFTLLNHSTK